MGGKMLSTGQGKFAAGFGTHGVTEREMSDTFS